MGVPRYAARADSNSSELVDFARTLGCVVVHIREPLDLLVGIGGKWFPTEIKRPEVRGKAGEFKPQQLEFFAQIAPHGLPHWVWYDIQSIRDCIANQGDFR